MLGIGKQEERNLSRKNANGPRATVAMILR